jgi:hypothetical protein
MKYFHRTSLEPDLVMSQAVAFFGTRLAPVEEAARMRRFSGQVGQVLVSAKDEAGHYTLVTVETNQPGESEADRLAKRFLTLLHTRAHPAHDPRGAY